MLTLFLLALVLAVVWDKQARFHFGGKDGGPKSRVHMWGFESKRYFSILVLRFGAGTREAYHSHAFNAVSWVLSGTLKEQFFEGPWRFLDACPAPVITRRTDVHKVSGFFASNWVLSFRGPWSATWLEVVDGRLVRLTHGRKEVAL